MDHQRPLLLSKLQTALSCLYGSHRHSDQLHGHEAHRFLLTFKSSNLRRLVLSKIQSRKDKSFNVPIATSDDLHRHYESSSNGNAPLIGSIYLSCLALLLASSTSHKRIFVAQTLNHRCRSIKLVETCDIEAEDGLEFGVSRLVLAWEERRQSENCVRVEETKVVLNAWLERYLPMLVRVCAGNTDNNSLNNNNSLCEGGQLLAVVLERHSASLSIGSEEGERGEERTKGNLMMLTLAVALYSLAFAECEEEYCVSHQHQQQQQQTPWANAVLSELASALSITALRMRYRPSSNKHDTPTSEPGIPSLIDLSIHFIHVVAECATHFFSRQQHSYHNTVVEACHKHAIRRSIAACLTALPETVLLPPTSEDNSHRIPSIDRACLRAASMELRCESSSHSEDAKGTGMERMLWEMIRSEVDDVPVDAENLSGKLDDASASRLLECCEAWARFVSVPIPVLVVTVGQLAVRYFDVKQDEDAINGSIAPSYSKAQNAAFQYVTSIFDGASPSLTVQCRLNNNQPGGI
jgi:hypothetical protein